MDKKKSYESFDNNNNLCIDKTMKQMRLHNALYKFQRTQIFQKIAPVLHANVNNVAYAELSRKLTLRSIHEATRIL